MRDERPLEGRGFLESVAHAEELCATATFVQYPQEIARSPGEIPANLDSSDTKYIRQQERYPNIEFSADVQFIGVQNDFWVVEVIATVENKGKAQHRMEEFCFDLNAIEKGSPILTSERWDNQVDFPVPLAKGSFLPAQYTFFFIDPGLKAKYSYITRIPVTASFAILHCWFKYGDKRKLWHTAERTVMVPAGGGPGQTATAQTQQGGTHGG